MQIDKYFTKTGVINTAIIRRDWFKESKDYTEIKKLTQCLDVLSPSISQRIRYIKQGYKSIPLCEICKKSHVVFNTYKGDLFKRACSKTCGSKIRGDNTNTGLKNAAISNNVRELIIQKYNNKDYIYNYSKCIKFCKERIHKTEGGVYSNWLYNNHYTKYDNEICSLIEYTDKYISHLSPSNMNISERVYIITNNLHKIPTCRICNTNTKYINFNKGYQHYCSSICSNTDSLSKKINHYAVISEFLNKNGYKINTSENDYILNGGISSVLNITHTKCSNSFDKFIGNGGWKRLLCPKCETNKLGTSHEEKQIYDFISSIYSGEIIPNAKILDGSHPDYPHNKREIDIYLPTLKIGIEYNGVYYHQDRKKHLLKWEECNRRGIYLIQINTYQWQDIQFRSIFTNYIKSLLDINVDIIYGRKCDIRVIDSKISSQFLFDNHFQGKLNSKINLGLFYNDELISVMTFGKPRFNKSYQYELHRYCTKYPYKIIGGSEKILKYFTKKYNPTSIISYCDNSLFNGNVYKKLKFSKLHISDPNFFWWKGNNILSRYQTQKHKLSGLFENIDMSVSAVKNMENNNYKRYFDCGNTVWGITYISK